MKKSAIGNIFKEILGKKEKRANREKEIVKLAQRRGGRLSILEIVAETSMDSTEADEILAEMTTKGYVNMEITEVGAIIYEFPGLAEKFQLENQDLLRREITRERATPSPDPESPPLQKSETRQKSTTDASPLPFPDPKKKRESEVLEFPSPSPSKPKVVQKVKTNNFTFELQECQRSGKNVTCHLLIKSNKHDKKLAVRPGAKIFDESGKNYPARVQVVSSNARDSIDYLWLSLKAGIPLKVSVSATISSWQVKMIALLELHCKNDILGSAFSVQFHDISLRG